MSQVSGVVSAKFQITTLSVCKLARRGPERHSGGSRMPSWTNEAMLARRQVLEGRASCRCAS